MRALSLYSGIGGMDLAAEWAGFEIIAHCEADEWTRSVLESRFSGVASYESDTDLTADELDRLGPIDIVIGGPPCQPHSHAGLQMGAGDPRNRFPEALRIVRDCAPRWVVWENVAGARPYAESSVLPSLRDLGYNVGILEFPVCLVGAPHRRQRIFIVAHAISE